MPEFVRLASVKLGAVLYCPENDMLVSDKISATKDIFSNNSHERDAAAAALAAYSNYKQKISDVMGFLSDKRKTYLRDKFFDKAIKNINLAYNQVLDIVEPQQPKEAELIGSKASSSVTSSADKMNDPVSSYLKRINDLLRQNAMIEKENNRLKENINSLLRQIQKSSYNGHRNLSNSEKELMRIIEFKEKRFHSVLASFRELEKRSKETDALQQKILSYSKKQQEYLFIDYFNTLNFAEKEIHDKRAVVFVENINSFSPNSLNQLNNNEIVIISPQKASPLLKKQLNCVTLHWLGCFYEKLGSYVVIKKYDLDKKLSEAESFEKIVNEYKDSRAKELMQ